jgi:hypothetical protein
MGKHTPAPWTIDHERILTQLGTTIALVTYADGTIVQWPILMHSPHTEDGTCDANARLIAAAPDLLAAAEDAEVQCDQAATILAEYGDRDQYAAAHADQLTDVAMDLRRAIHLARGKV